MEQSMSMILISRWNLLEKSILRRTKPKFDFTANVSSIRPYYLNIDKSDPDYFASFLLKTNFTGRNIDDLDGEIKLVNSFFQKTGKQIQIYDLSLLRQILQIQTVSGSGPISWMEI